jgi:outer membrane protein assembly factor BamA
VLKAGKYLFILSFLLSAGLFYAGCGSARKLKSNELLLRRNTINTSNADLNKEEINTYIRQKPNRRLLYVYPFYLEIYNLVNQDKLKSQKQHRDARIDAINEKRKIKNEALNEKRKAAGKAEKPLKLKSKDRLTFREWLVNIGEEPSIYDSTLTKRSVKQIRLYLNNKGYFNNTVKDSVVKFGKKVSVHYNIKTPQPYTIRHISYEIDDNLVDYYVLSDTMNCLVQPGQNYNVDLLQKERERITKLLKNEGYYYFTKEYIYFSVDSALNNHQVDLTIGIKKQSHTISSSNDSVVETNHERYQLNDIYIVTDYVPSSDAQVQRDTLKVQDGYIFMYEGKLKFKTGIILNEVYMHSGELYQDQNYENTYRHLVQLRAFKQVLIEFVPARNHDKNRLDCIIRLAPVKKHSLALASEATNTGGNLGVNGNLVYQNKNAFRGAEIFELKMKGALEVQKLVADIGVQNNKNFLVFNTFMLGPELNVYVPRALFPFNLFKIGKSANPRSTFTSYYNFQHRPDYTRSILNTGYSYDWREGKYKKHIIFPFEVNLVKLLHIDPAFQTYLDAKNDLYLKSRFQDHFTTDTRWTFTFSNQEPKKKKDYIFFRLDLESSGTILRSLMEAANKLGNHAFDKDTSGSYRIANIKYSQYVKGGFDIRFYKSQTEHNRLVFRTAAGIGVPLSNLNSLPFEKSFFAGGPNSVRAFPARSLGPGSYNHSGGTLYQLGDMSIEANIEYRYKIFKMLNTAIFMDAGNIWLLRPDPQRPGGDFEQNRFYKEFAIGAGVGLRLDFDFFIIRLDAGVPLRDPSYPENDRWTFNKRPLQRTNLNFGIGYPF